MKPKPTLPKGRVAWFAPDWTYWAKTRLEEGSFPVAVIPCTSPKQARALLKLHNTPKEELVGRVKQALIKQSAKQDYSWGTMAEAAVKEILP